MPENIRDLEGHSWRTADTQSMAIGQGSLTATPLQVLRMMAAVANGGRLVTPHVVSEGACLQRTRLASASWDQRACKHASYDA